MVFVLHRLYRQKKAVALFAFVMLMSTILYRIDGPHQWVSLGHVVTYTVVLCVLVTALLCMLVTQLSFASNRCPFHLHYSFVLLLHNLQLSVVDWPQLPSVCWLQPFFVCWLQLASVGYSCPVYCLQLLCVRWLQLSSIGYSCPVYCLQLLFVCWLQLSLLLLQFFVCWLQLFSVCWLQLSFECC